MLSFPKNLNSWEIVICDISTRPFLQYLDASKSSCSGNKISLLILPHVHFTRKVMKRYISVWNKIKVAFSHWTGKMNYRPPTTRGFPGAFINKESMTTALYFTPAWLSLCRVKLKCNRPTYWTIFSFFRLAVFVTVILVVELACGQAIAHLEYFRLIRGKYAKCFHWSTDSQNV